MKLNVSKTSLLSALQKVDSIVGTKSTMQILSNVLLETENNKLILTTTDLDIRIRKEISAEVLSEGVLTLPVKKFLEIVREFSCEDISLESIDTTMTVIGGNAKIKLLGLPPEGFPVPEESSVIRSFTLNQIDLYRNINLVSYSVKQDEGRKAINGILFSLNEGTLTNVATDGKRLALVEKTVDSFVGTDGDTIVPLRASREICKLLGKSGSVRVDILANAISFVLDDLTIMTSKFIVDNYPNYKLVIPVMFNKNLTLNKDLLLSTLRRVSTVVTESSSNVKLVFQNNKLEISASSQEIGDCSDYIDIDYSVEEVAVGFNHLFLREPLEKIDSNEILLKMNDQYSPILISNNDGFIYIVMPIKKKSSS